MPTGAGKTLAAILPWLYRRRLAPDPKARASTPHWLVYVLPMRVLVDQTISEAQAWLRNLDLMDAVRVYRVVGGEGKLEAGWRSAPEADAIFVGTLDMITSRQLNRGYGEGRHMWPIDFGLFNNGCHFVYDEVQLMGPALPTSRQLQGLRRALGEAAPCSATWMSATLEQSQLLTVDAPDIRSVVALTDKDRAGSLAQRLSATKTVSRLETGHGRHEESIARAALEHHRPGSLSLVILNTVTRARETYRHIARSGHPDTVLLHSRFRPADRRTHVSAALADIDPAGPGRIIVSTQVVEAGVDISARLLITESAPWPSIVQRAGRCNRDGVAQEASLLWCRPPSSAPYEPEDCEATARELATMEDLAVTGEELGRRRVTTGFPVHSVLRRRDLIELFDTTPDLNGNDIDVSRFIRPADDLDVDLAWRPLGDRKPEPGTPAPGSEERCPVPLGDVRALLKERTKAWRFDYLEEDWIPCRVDDLRPGLALLLDVGAGGYSPEIGWDPRAKEDVQPVDSPSFAWSAESEGAGSDSPSVVGRWVTLVDHLAAAERATRDLLERVNPAGLSAGHRDAAIVAARLHDVGKAHPAFQDMLLATEPDPTSRDQLEANGPWAKSAKGGGPRNRRRGFRHELAGALALLGEAGVALDGLAERDLAVYLVAAHHGRVRLGFRPLPFERPTDGRDIALGVADGEVLPAVAIPGMALPPSVLDLSPMRIGDAPSGPSWTTRIAGLRDRPDLGPFRLGFLEAVVRLADWRVSAVQAVQDA